MDSTLTPATLHRSYGNKVIIISVAIPVSISVTR